MVRLSPTPSPALSTCGRAIRSVPDDWRTGRDYGFVVTFDDVRAWDSYLVDERHRVVAGGAIGNSAQRIVMFDIRRW